MIACILLFVILMPVVFFVVFFASTVENLFTPDELASMGVQLASSRD